MFLKPVDVRDTKMLKTKAKRINDLKVSINTSNSFSIEFYVHKERSLSFG